MVELVDTQDLKSCSRKRSAGSIPALSTFIIDMKPGMKISGFVVFGVRAPSFTLKEVVSF
jgi:hypothetical protein